MFRDRLRGKSDHQDVEAVFEVWEQEDTWVCFFLPACCLVLVYGRDSYQMFQMSPKTPPPPVLRGSKGSPVICGRRKPWLWLSPSSPLLCFGSWLSPYCLGQLLFWLLASQLQETMLWVRKSQRQEPIKSLGSGIICFHQAFWSLEQFLAHRIAKLQLKMLKA